MRFISSLRTTTLIGLLLVACSPAAPPSSTGSSSSSTAPAQAANQVLRIGTTRFPSGPTQIASAFNIAWYGAQFDSLVNFDQNYNIVPGIATKWELLPDNSAWRFTLREDLTFSNGDKLTAEDVAFTVSEQTALRSPQWALSPFLTGAKVVNPTTVDLLISQRDVSTLYNGPGWLIWSKKAYESMGKDAFLQKPIGSGPYVLESFNTGNQMVYKLRPNYTHPYRRPILTEIQVKNVPDPAALLAGMRTGEIDMMLTVSISPDQAKAAKDAGMNVEIQQVSYMSLLFNEALSKGTPLEDMKVRQALNYAVDKEAIARTIYAGFAAPIGQYAVPGLPHYNPDLKPVPFDVATAKKLLAEAGYPNGFRMPGGLQFNNNPLNTSLFQAVQSYHRDIGVTYDLEGVEPGTYVDLAYGRGGKTRKEMFEAGSSNTNGVFSFTWFFLKCDGGAGWWCVPELDKNMQIALAEPDTAKRNQSLQTAVKSLRDTWNMIYLLGTPQFTVMSTKVKGFQWTTPTYYYLDSVFLAQ